MLLVINSVVRFCRHNLFLIYQKQFSVSSIILVMRLGTEINFSFKIMGDSLVIASNSVNSVWKNDRIVPVQPVLHLMSFSKSNPVKA